ASGRPAAAGDRADVDAPAGEQAAAHEADRRRHDQPSRDRQWSLADDEPDPGADEEEGPQAPRLDREVPVDEAGLDGEGHRAEEDEHDPPAEEPAVDAHGPQGTPRPSVRVLASRASCPPRSAGSSAGPSAALRPRWRSGTVPPNYRRRSMRLSEWRALATPGESMSQKFV